MGVGVSTVYAAFGAGDFFFFFVCFDTCVKLFASWQRQITMNFNSPAAKCRWLTSTVIGMPTLSDQLGI
jgi:hypothetical protein